MVDEGLRQGALGVGVPVGYMTTGVTQYELYKYQELAAKYGRLPMDMYALPASVLRLKGNWVFRKCWPMPWFWMRLSWLHT